MPEGQFVRRIVYIVTVPETAHAFLMEDFRALRDHSFSVHLITAPGPHVAALERDLGIETHTVGMRRRFSPFWDLASLLRILLIIFNIRPAIVNYATPKAAFLGALASWAARVPVRVYELRGLRMETARGVGRLVLAAVERITSACSTQVLCVSKSLHNVYGRWGLSRPDKLTVFGRGTYHGFDADDLSGPVEDPEQLHSLKQELGIPPGAKVIGYVGRLNRDKGIGDLYRAFSMLTMASGQCVLLLVGPIERDDPLPAELVEGLRSHPGIRLAGATADVASYYRIMDIFAFPSYREGLPQAPLEASYAGVPTVGYAATGTVDAVIDGETGLLAPVGCIDEFAGGLLRLLEDDVLRRTLGANANAYVRREFPPGRGAEVLLEYYAQLLTGS